MPDSNPSAKIKSEEEGGLVAVAPEGGVLVRVAVGPEDGVLVRVGEGPAVGVRVGVFTAAAVAVVVLVLTVIANCGGLLPSREEKSTLSLLSPISTKA